MPCLVLVVEHASCLEREKAAIELRWQIGRIMESAQVGNGMFHFPSRLLSRFFFVFYRSRTQRETQTAIRSLFPVSAVGRGTRHWPCVTSLDDQKFLSLCLLFVYPLSTLFLLLLLQHCVCRPVMENKENNIRRLEQQRVNE